MAEETKGRSSYHEQAALLGIEVIDVRIKHQSYLWKFRRFHYGVQSVKRCRRHCSQGQEQAVKIVLLLIRKYIAEFERNTTFCGEGDVGTKLFADE